MAYDIRLVKLINGDMVIGKFGEAEGVIKDVAAIQTVPTQQGVQMVLLPFGYPFEQDIRGEIKLEHVIYEYDKCPEELTTKYMEAVSNLTLSAPGGLGNLNLGDPGGNPDLSGLLKK